MEIPPLDPQTTLFDGLPVPLWPVTLERELSSHRPLLGLQPGVSACPSAEVLVTIATGRKSVRALARACFGESLYRSLDNLAKGNTSRTRLAEHMAQRGGADAQQLMEFARDIFASPVDRSIVTRAMLAFEGFLYRMGSMLFRYKIPCACCGENVLPTARQWWAKQDVEIGRPEHELIDRILLDVIAFSLLSSYSARMPLMELAQSGAHPQANWLVSLKRLLGAAHLELKALPHRAGATKVSEARVWAYARGENIPPEAIDDLLRRVENPSQLRQAAAIVRSLSLAADLLQASCRAPAPAQGTARRLVELRLCEFLRQAELIITHLEVRLKFAQSTRTNAAPTTAPGSTRG